MQTQTTLLTVERHPEEESVGDVHYDDSQQIESVHVSRGVGHLLQVVQMFGCGAHADLHCTLEARTCQSCRKTNHKDVQYFKHKIAAFSRSWKKERERGQKRHHATVFIAHL